MEDEKIIFKINGLEYEEGHYYKDENERTFMVVRATRN
jgi:hypothetical protein